MSVDEKTYFNSLILQSEAIQRINGFIRIFLFLIINKPVAETLS